MTEGTLMTTAGPIRPATTAPAVDRGFWATHADLWRAAPGNAVYLLVVFSLAMIAIFAKLGLEESPTEHRHVLAVLAFLQR